MVRPVAACHLSSSRWVARSATLVLIVVLPPMQRPVIITMGPRPVPPAGYAKLSPTSILNQVKKWKGPLLLGGPTIQCGEYKFLPGGCSDGNYFFRYEGNGKWKRVSTWLHPPAQVIAALKALPVGALFPTG